MSGTGIIYNGQEKAEILKEAIKIVDELATYDIHEDIDEIDELINKSIKLKKNRLWKL